MYNIIKTCWFRKNTANFNRWPPYKGGQLHTCYYISQTNESKGCQENISSRDEIYKKNSRIHLDRLQNKFTHCKGIRNNTDSRQTTGIEGELDTTCKQNASWQTTQDNETLFSNWQKESWKTSEETSRYVRPERVNKWPNSMTDMMMMTNERHTLATGTCANDAWHVIYVGK